MLKELRRLFLVGVFASAPLALTIWIFIKIFETFDSFFQPIVQPALAPYFSRPIPGIGIALGILVILFVGLVAPSLIGKQIIFVVERAVQRVPLAKLVYSGTKQIFDSFSRSPIGKFSRVVMVEFPRPDSYAIGFVTQELSQGWVPDHPECTLAVFIPTTPNPTSGYLIFVDSKATIPMTLTVEEALKLVISGGLIHPPELKRQLNL